MEKPTIYYDSLGEGGNIFFLLGQVSKALRKQRRICEFNELRDEVFNSSSYNEALSVIRQHVVLIDTSSNE